MTEPRKPLRYQDAGVDIDAGNALVERIKPIAARTRRAEVLAGLGGFGALCQIPPGYREPVLVSATDGVGTKLRLAMDLGHHGDVGIDLVAMCVNDLVVSGAEPLFFLDYYATGKLDVDVAATVIEGIGRGCELAGCALVGGETAEMPDMYHGGDYDLAGFSVGVVERAQILDGSAVRGGDALVGLASTGPHSNGFSLIRKVLRLTGTEPRQTQLAGCSLADALLTPTRIYVKSLLALRREVPVHALAHITGGGLLENVPRVLPPATRAVIDTRTWALPPVFEWLRTQGNVDDLEMYRTFNCGIGMVICLPEHAVSRALAVLRDSGETPMVIGAVSAAPGGTATVELQGLARV